MNWTSQHVKRLSLLLLFLALGATPPNEGVEGFGQANELYREGRYQEAAEVYERLVSEGLTSPALYYNLGNAHFKQGQIGKAILSYERAIRLAPKDKEILGNLAYAREFVQDKVAGPEPPAWVRRLNYLYELLTLNMATALSSFFYFLLTFVLCLMIVRPDARKAMRRWLLVIGIFLSASLSLLGTKLASERYSHAIIIAREVEVRYGPSLQETKAFLLHEGTSCMIRQVEGDWVLIWLPNDRGGWVQQESLERI